jgi:hypothetical protein
MALFKPGYVQIPCMFHQGKFKTGNLFARPVKNALRVRKEYRNLQAAAVRQGSADGAAMRHADRPGD